MVYFLFLLNLFFQDSLAVRSAPSSLNPMDTVRVQVIEQGPMSLRDFFSALSNQYHVNIYVDGDINIMDSFRFYSRTVSEIVRFVADRHGLDVIFENGIYRIRKRPIPPPKPQPVPEPKLPDITYTIDSLSLNLYGEPLDSFVKHLSKVSGKSVLVEQYTEGKVSGHLKNTAFDSGLRELLRMNSLRLKIENGIYKIYRDYRQMMEAQENKNKTGFYIDYTDSLIFLDIPKAKIADVVGTLIQEAGIDVMYYSPLEGDLSAKFTVKTLEEALLTIFRNTNLTFKVENGIYYFGKKDQQELVIQEVIKLKYLRAGKGSDSGFRSGSNLGNLYGSNGASGVFQGNPVQSSEPNASSQDLGVQNARSQNQSSQNYNNNRSSQGNLGRQRSRGNSSAGYSGSQSSSAGFTADALFAELTKRDITAVPLLEQNAILITGTKLDIEDARGIIRMLDRPIPQILIEALVIDVKDGNGISQEVKAWRQGKTPLDTAMIQTSYIPFGMLFNAADLNPITTKIADAVGLKRIGKLPEDFLAFVKLQETKQNLKIKSRPQIATLNGHEAYISIGETRYYKLTSNYLRESQQTDNTNVGIRYNERYEALEINTSLRVKPWVNSDGDVTVEIKPVLQSPEGGTEGIPPSINVRELESTVRLKNGETIILGGLIKEEENEVVRDAFPLLSWIPWLGELFVSKTKEKSKSELMIYVTPYVYVDEDVDSYIPQSDFK